MSLVQTVMAIVDTGRISVPTVVESLYHRGRPLDPSIAERRLAWWSKKLLDDAGVTLAVTGREHAGDGTEPLIVMSNHQSHYDIPVLFQSGLGALRMVTKAELFKVPIWGRAMAHAGFIRIDRHDRGQAVDALRAQGGSVLAAGMRVWIAPEGTRSRTGELGPFKSGGFRMALDHGVRILPVAIDGTREVLPAQGVVVQRGKRVRVTILPAIDPAAYGVEKRKELMEAVREAIAGGAGSRGRLTPRAPLSTPVTRFLHPSCPPDSACTALQAPDRTAPVASHRSLCERWLAQEAGPTARTTPSGEP